MPIHQLKRLRWAVRLVLTLGVAASVAANILHADEHPISQAIAAWPPLALLLTVELVSRIPVHRRGLAAVRIFATASIAGIAAWISYWHMVGTAAEYGEQGTSPYLLPITVDGLIVVASVSLVELAGNIRAREAMLAPPTVAVVAPAPAPSVPASTTVEVGEPVPAVTKGTSGRPRGRSGPQVTGPSKPGLMGTPLMTETPQT